MALHTTSNLLQMALGEPPKLTSQEFPLGRDLGKYMHSHLADLMQNNWQNLVAVAVHTGEGSLTGKRIGLAVAQTIAQQLQIPYYTIDDATSAPALLDQAWQIWRRQNL